MIARVTRANRMHGLVNTAIQSFCRDAYGGATWDRVMRASGTGLAEFEAMLTYDDAVTDEVLRAMADVLGKPREDILEDLGTYLVSHPNVESLRRLLRFGGVSFQEFLYSLDDLPDRARLAVPDLDLPALELRDHSATDYTLSVTSQLAGAGHVFVGILRAMADDYGALAFLEHAGRRAASETISVRLVEQSYAEGRQFDLAAAR